MLINTLTPEDQLYQEVIQHIQNHSKLVLAFSGGLDSTVLLDILHTINTQTQSNTYNISTPFTLRAIHIHHGLNYYSNHWAKHCFKECKKRNIPFNLIYAHYNKKNNQGGIEATARQIRYQKLFENIYKQETLLTAQHLNDQAETFLLALKRGSGPKGLSGMQKKTFFSKYQLLLRPFLQCTKEQIQLYAKKKKLIWITDNSNSNTRFDRNFLRLQIMPILKNRWPGINHTISRSAQLCAEQETLLDELLQQELKSLYHTDQSLLLKPLIHMSIQKRQALIRRWLTNFNIQMPSYDKLNHIWNNIILSKKDSTPIMVLNKENLLRRFQNRLYIIPKSTQTLLNDIIIPWNNFKKRITLPNNLGTLTSIKSSNIKSYLLDEKKNHIKKIILLPNNFWQSNYINKKILTLSLVRSPNKQEKISIRFKYLQNSNIRIIGKVHSKKIKKIWQELKIPPWIRNNTPLLFYNNKLISALGIFTTQDGNITNKSKVAGIFWLQKTIK
ncbi:tRNA lysidine(34) synthetase TilS [Blochmannia endosymbiont of Polyrhachis (Hedomyrma) turneri]|uniref:tRNA lysidine(34) synthetase TilS n=1 Tax=Blochmannia endosymbiont of Polyrhachis (Hedomyrma) turneri TaxID=1505596 RepID=UPI00061A7E3C|nr:tRNA lysidine(34) synthetase TilS [Blochmannia endosymbiont of Polyrhachis (Hedomyrma) turneri]AKC59850.1 tRNA(Ile)-lysidine synthase [Blochmannia endosymbiont of Polyrhachis (Hedomyrma) turneri]